MQQRILGAPTRFHPVDPEVQPIVLTGPDERQVRVIAELVKVTPVANGMMLRWFARAA